MQEGRDPTGWAVWNSRLWRSGPVSYSRYRHLCTYFAKEIFQSWTYRSTAAITFQPGKHSENRAWACPELLNNLLWSKYRTWLYVSHTKVSPWTNTQMLSLLSVPSKNMLLDVLMICGVTELLPAITSARWVLWRLSCFLENTYNWWTLTTSALMLAYRRA